VADWTITVAPDGQSLAPPRLHDMGIGKPYLNLIVAGTTTTEIRVNDARRRAITPGSLIRFSNSHDRALTRVTRVAHYASFENMFDHESLAAISPIATCAKQLAAVRQIYPPEREALGVLAIGIVLLTGSSP
jgi:ASC-1-like (ASCH) protein